MKEMYQSAGILPEVYDFCKEIENTLEDRFKTIDETACQSF